MKEFDDAVFSSPIGTLSQPVKTQYGYHILRVDKRVKDTVFAHHILKLVKQGDSAATKTDRLADQLAKGAAGSLTPAAFDSAAKTMNLLVSRITVTEGQPASYLGRAVPSASAWAFGGPRPGESSDLFDDEAAYYLVRLDSIQHSGVQDLAVVKDEVRDAVARQKALDAMQPKAKELAQASARGTLDDAAKAANRPVAKAGPFARSTPVGELGFVSEATGAAFTLPVGVVSDPVRTEDAIYVMRVDKRVQSDSAKWSAQKGQQRLQVTNSLREQKVRLYVENLRGILRFLAKHRGLREADRARRLLLLALRFRALLFIGERRRLYREGARLLASGRVETLL